jgi:hypothetical protein
MLRLLGATWFYIREVTVALTSVQQEVRDERFMDLPAIRCAQCGRSLSLNRPL